MVDLPEPGKQLAFSMESFNRIGATSQAMTDGERRVISEALDEIEAGTWDSYLWFEDLDVEGLVLMWLDEDLMMAWRLLPGADDVADVIYAGHPRLYR